MNRIRFPLILIPLCACIAITSAFGQDSLNVTLEQSVAIALQKNPEIRIAEKEVSKASVGVGEAVAGLLPKVNGSVNFQHAWSIQKTTIPNFIKLAMQLPDGSYVLPGVDQSLSQAPPKAVSVH